MQWFDDTIAAHTEISHGFDDEGRQYDGNGNFADWWAPEPVKKFTGLSECFVQQVGLAPHTNIPFPMLNIITGVSSQWATGTSHSDNDMMCGSESGFTCCCSTASLR